jgi:hypothetical protein
MEKAGPRWRLGQLRDLRKLFSAPRDLRFFKPNQRRVQTLNP